VGIGPKGVGVSWVGEEINLERPVFQPPKSRPLVFEERSISKQGEGKRWAREVTGALVQSRLLDPKKKTPSSKKKGKRFLSKLYLFQLTKKPHRGEWNKLSGKRKWVRVQWRKQRKVPIKNRKNDSVEGNPKKKRKLGFLSQKERSLKNLS